MVIIIRAIRGLVNEIRKILLNPSVDGQAERREIAEAAAVVQGCSGLLMGSFAMIAAINLLAFNKVFAFVAFLGVSAAAHEVMIVSRNVGRTMEGDGLIANAINRVSAAFSERAFTRAITKDTWIIGPVFGPVIELSLKDN